MRGCNDSESKFVLLAIGVLELGFLWMVWKVCFWIVNDMRVQYWLHRL